MRESEVQAQAIKQARARGWFVHLTAQDKSTRRHVAGLPDALLFRDNRTLLVEFKASTGGKVRTSQRVFQAGVRQHEGPNLRYLVVYHPRQSDYVEAIA